MFKGTNLILNSDVDEDTWMFDLPERSLTYRCTNRNIKRRENKDKDSTVHTTEYRTRRNQQ